MTEHLNRAEKFKLLNAIKFPKRKKMAYNKNRDFDVVIFGASGFVGQYVIEELAHSSISSKLKWAIAGRNKEKLRESLKIVQGYLGKEIDITETPLIEADVNNALSLLNLCKRTKLILNCVGPYNLYGEAVIKACIEAGTHHIDLSAETKYLEETQTQYFQAAREKNVYIVLACGMGFLIDDYGISALKKHFPGDLNAVEYFETLKIGPDLYVDFKQAYDSINRELMLWTLHEFIIPHKIIRLIRMTTSSTKTKVKVQNKMFREFDIVAGLRQGDILSTLLFNVCLEKVMRNTVSNRGGTIFNRTKQVLAFADDVILIARSKNALVDLFKVLIKEASLFGLEINSDKTKYMIMDCRGKYIDTELQINEITKFVRVREFKYLGSVVTENNGIMPEIKQRLNAGNRSYFALERLLTSKEKDIINYVKAKRIQWLGHLERMEENRGTKKIFKGQCQGQRKRGRPVKRWFDEVEKDLKTLKFRNWKQRARDRRLGGKLLVRPWSNMDCNAREYPPIFYSSEEKRWCVWLLYANSRCLQRSQLFRYNYLNDRPIMSQSYVSMPHFFMVLIVAIYAIFLVIMTRFSFGQSLLAKYPSFFSAGIFSSEGPTRKQVMESGSKFTFYGQGWKEKLSNPTDQHNTKPDTRMKLTITGPEPAYPLTAMCMVQAGLTVLQEQDKIPLQGGVLTPGVAFENTSLQKRLEKRGVTFKYENIH
nr:saccharopine dehydrogenase-like oxidoreductase [Parasteatoda tepidariorum]